VKILGELVDIEAIEGEILSLSGGRISAGDFAVAALPDARAEHRLVPVFAQSANRDAVMETLQAYQSQAGGLKRLQSAVFVNALPRSPLGKLLRGELIKLVET
jgi:O-succinylbenzoic acid--CoA ligase